MFNDLLVWLMILGSNFLGALLYFVVACEAAYREERKDRKQIDRTARVAFFAFTAAVVLNGVLVTYWARFGTNNTQTDRFVRLFMVVGSILMLLASFVIAWGANEFCCRAQPSCSLPSRARSCIN